MRGSPITQILTVFGLFVLAYWAFVVWVVVILAALGAVALLVWWLTSLFGGSRGSPKPSRLPTLVVPPVAAPPFPHPAGTRTLSMMEKPLSLMAETEFDARTQVIERLWANTQVSRERIFGPADRLPEGARTDARDMWAGYVGPQYRPGGLVLVAYYPAGGTTPYGKTARAARDEAFYELIAAFKRADRGSRAAAFKALNRHVAKALPQWRMYKVIQVVLEAAGVSLDDVALINLVPYRIADNISPAAQVVQAAWAECTGPALRALQPGKVAALGTAPGLALNARGVSPLYVFPRTIGDSYVHPKAYAAARELAGGRLPATSAATASVRRPAATAAAPAAPASRPPRRAASGGRQTSGDIELMRFRLGANTPSTTSVHGKIRAVVARRSGLSGAELLVELRKLDFSGTASPHTANGTPADDWFIGYLRGSLRRGYLQQDEG